MMSWKRSITTERETVPVLFVRRASSSIMHVLPAPVTPSSRIGLPCERARASARMYNCVVGVSARPLDVSLVVLVSSSSSLMVFFDGLWRY